MTRKFLPLLLIAALFMGCASTPREQYSDLNDAYIASVQTLIEAKQADVFTDEEWQDAILPAIVAGDALLDEYDMTTGADQPDASVVRRLRRVLERLEPFVVRALSHQEE